LPAPGEPPDARALRTARRQLVLDGLGIVVSAAGFGFVFGLTARTVGHFSPVEAMAMSLIAFGGAAQFAAIGYVASGLAWPAIALLTFLLNARHALYSAALAPWFRGRSLTERALAAHLLTDESFALAVTHFKRVGRFDAIGYWYPGDRHDPHPVEYRDVRRRVDRRRDRRTEPLRDRRHLPCGDGRG